jgi:hypothetical protein
LGGRRLLLLGLLAAPARAEASPVPAWRAALAEARAALCPRCADDIERTGINHPMLRMMRAEAALDRALELLERPTTGQAEALRPRLLARILRAREANARLDEDLAHHEITRALRLMRSLQPLSDR